MRTGMALLISCAVLVTSHPPPAEAAPARKALLRLEDVGPGGSYDSEEALVKLRAIADYLQAAQVPFHVAMIPRHVDPATGYDKSIAQRDDPYVQSFVQTMDYLHQRGGSLGMHGYTHQYGSEATGGYEFAYPGCSINCPPPDNTRATMNRPDWEAAYASQRIRAGLDTVRQSGLPIEWFESPHYAASPQQRSILEGWFGLHFENSPRNWLAKRPVIADTDTPLYRGSIYVPTPLDYIDLSRSAESEIGRVCSSLSTSQADDLASFFYHPRLEFPFIHVDWSSGSPQVVEYEDNSYLKQIVRCLQQQNAQFVHALDLVPFVPSQRQTDFYRGAEHVVLTSDLDGDKTSELLIWNQAAGRWASAKGTLDAFPSRRNAPFLTRHAAAPWAQGPAWHPLTGDFSGDGRDDVVVYDATVGDWQVALSDGTLLHPQGAWLRPWAVGRHAWQPLVGDFDGDGKQDLAVREASVGHWHVALSTGQSFVPRAGASGGTWLDQWAVGTHWQPLVGDFNGDRRDDLAVWDPGTGDWQVALSDGTQFRPSAGRGDAHWLLGWATSAGGWVPRVGDFDADGRDDLLVVAPQRGDWQVARSTGTQFEPAGGALAPWAADPHMQPLVGVFTTDGRSSVVARHPYLRDGTIDFAVSVIGR